LLKGGRSECEKREGHGKIHFDRRHYGGHKEEAVCGADKRKILKGKRDGNWGGSSDRIQTPDDRGNKKIYHGGKAFLLGKARKRKGAAGVFVSADRD